MKKNMKKNKFSLKIGIKAKIRSSKSCCIA